MTKPVGMIDTFYGIYLDGDGFMGAYILQTKRNKKTVKTNKRQAMKQLHGLHSVTCGASEGQSWPREYWTQQTWGPRSGPGAGLAALGLAPSPCTFEGALGDLAQK